MDYGVRLPCGFLCRYQMFVALSVVERGGNDVTD